MGIKSKSILIITISSMVIGSVLALTIFGFYAYLEWKEKNMERKYRLSLYDLNGQIFDRYVTVNLQTKIDTEGVFANRAVVEGAVKNNSNKKIYLLKLKVLFCDSEDRVLYVDEFYPAGLELESIINIGYVTENFLSEGDSISFKHQLKNCPPSVLDYLWSRLKFAKTEHIEPIKLNYKIESLDIR